VTVQGETLSEVRLLVQTLVFVYRLIDYVKV